MEVNKTKRKGKTRMKKRVEMSGDVAK